MLIAALNSKYRTNVITHCALHCQTLKINAPNPSEIKAKETNPKPISLTDNIDREAYTKQPMEIINIRNAMSPKMSQGKSSFGLPFFVAAIKSGTVTAVPMIEPTNWMIGVVKIDEESWLSGRKSKTKHLKITN